MRIIKSGKIDKTFFLFECKSCGCEFEAERREVFKEPEGDATGFYVKEEMTISCRCPCCGVMVRPKRKETRTVKIRPWREP